MWPSDSIGEAGGDSIAGVWRSKGRTGLQWLVSPGHQCLGEMSRVVAVEAFFDEKAEYPMPRINLYVPDDFLEKISEFKGLLREENSSLSAYFVRAVSEELKKKERDRPLKYMGQHI